MSYREYDQNKRFLLPPSLNEWVGEDVPVRVFSEIVDCLTKGMFKGGMSEGRPPYHPLMMTKVLLWGYATGVRSSRKIEDQLRTNVEYMWLSGMERPDFRTLCLFRTNNLEVVEEIFGKVLLTARAMGMGKLGIVALDGTKVQASAGIDSFRKIEDWRKELVSARDEVRKILAEAEAVDGEEDRLYGKGGKGNALPEGLKKAKERVERIEKALAFEGRQEGNRMSITDPEAVFMHRKNTSIPAYNAQAAVTEDQLIVYADVTAEPVDVNQLGPAAEGIETVLGEKPEKMLADTGYAGGANLELLESRGIEGYIPESGERNIGKAAVARPELFRKEEFLYDKERDLCICPGGQEMRPKARIRVKTKYSSHNQTIYRTDKGVCSKCSLRDRCTTDIRHGRSISRDGYEEQRQRMRDRLGSSEGKKTYGLRKMIVEPVFGQIRIVGGFDRFLLRGTGKAKLEWKLSATAHNLLKITRRIAEGSVKLPEPAI